MAAKAPQKKNLSALKRDRQSEQNRLHNRTMRTRMKNVVKAVETAVGEKNKEAAVSALGSAVKAIDQIHSKGVIHKNNASRKVSRLTKLVNQLSKAGAA